MSRALVKLCNQQNCSERLISQVHEAVACELDLEQGGLDRWVRVIEKIGGEDPAWLTDNFAYLISTRDGRPDGLEDLEKQQGLPAWGPAVSESVEMPAGTPGAGS